ncbi:hypothetical protein JL09_g5429 [Pichia kudriavzevii]|uniref:Uncharacterized protein n=1 Tax=Pichia kudriavzevii TaxID=4909 RepID=A0A099NU84_PICKU|nr:hypothetical protein JL09_g5429 [Pichia kudriavzevii]
MDETGIYIYFNNTNLRLERFLALKN